MLDGVLRWSSTCRPSRHGQSPDDLARTLADLPDLTGQNGQNGLALHSTSWRYEHGRVVLTYAVFPDPTVRGSWSGLGEHVAVSEGPVNPSPQRLCDADVAAHAARHLADLAAGRDPHLVACAHRQPQAWQSLLRHADRVHAHPSRAAEDDVHDAGADVAAVPGAAPTGQATVAGPVVLRPATEHDLALLVALNQQLIVDQGHGRSLQPAGLRDRMRRWLSGQYAVTLAELDGQVVAYAAWRTDEDGLHLRQFFVARGQRRTGLGRQVFALLATPWQGHPVRLDVLMHNERALHFWRSLGFEDVGVLLQRPAAAAALPYEASA